MGKVGCVSGAVTRRVPLDGMLHTVQVVQAGHLWTIYGPRMCCVWLTRVKRLKISKTFHSSGFFCKKGKTLSMPVWPKWAGLAVASTIPPTPRSVYSLTLLHWPLQTVPLATPVFEEQLEKAGKTGRGQVRNGRHTSSEIRKSRVQIWLHHLLPVTVSSFLNLGALVFKRHHMRYSWHHT